MPNVFLENLKRPKPIEGDDGDLLIPTPMVAGEFCVDRRTLSKWWSNPAIGFPKPVRIKTRFYLYKLIFDLTDGMSWPMSFQAALLSSMA